MDVSVNSEVLMCSVISLTTEKNENKNNAKQLKQKLNGATLNNLIPTKNFQPKQPFKPEQPEHQSAAQAVFFVVKATVAYTKKKSMC